MVVPVVVSSVCDLLLQACSCLTLLMIKSYRGLRPDGSICWQLVPQCCCHWHALCCAYAQHSRGSLADVHCHSNSTKDPCSAVVCLASLPQSTAFLSAQHRWLLPWLLKRMSHPCDWICLLQSFVQTTEYLCCFRLAVARAFTKALQRL
jgi:hypothetical protein